jgi:WD40 repeat protein
LDSLWIWKTAKASMMLLTWLVIDAATIFTATSSVRADEVTYSKDIEPFLRRNCLACHHSKKPDGGLSLESRADFAKGGDSGPLVVVGNASESLIVQRVLGVNDSIMPPEGNAVAASHLSSEQVDLLSRWIDAGARLDDLTATKEPSSHDAATEKELDDSVKSSYGVGVIADKDLVIYSRGNDLYMDSISKESDPHLLLANAHAGLIDAMIVSPDGRWLATSSHDEVIVWGVEFVTDDSQENHIPKMALRERLSPASFKKEGFRWIEDRVSSLAVSSDGKQLAIGSGQPSRSGTVAIVDLNGSKASLRVLLPEVHTDSVTSIAFAPDGLTLATGSADKMIKLIRLDVIPDVSASTAYLAIAATSDQVKNLEGHTGYVLGLDWNRDGNRLASVGADGSLRVWDIMRGECVSTIAVENELSAVHYMDNHPSLLAGASIDGSVRVFDSEKSEIVRTISVPNLVDPQYSLSQTSNPSHLISSGAAGVLHRWTICED